MISENKKKTFESIIMVFEDVDPTAQKLFYHHSVLDVLEV
jgi:hypothetical protein